MGRDLAIVEALDAPIVVPRHLLNGVEYGSFQQQLTLLEPQISAGGVVIGMSVAMITGQLTALSYWLLETFPTFAEIE